MSRHKCSRLVRIQAGVKKHVCTCVITVIQFGDEGVSVGRPGSGLHLVEGAAFQSVLNIVSQRTAEQLGTLGNGRNLTDDTVVLTICSA